MSLKKCQNGEGKKLKMSILRRCRNVKYDRTYRKRITIGKKLKNKKEGQNLKFLKF